MDGTVLQRANASGGMPSLGFTAGHSLDLRKANRDAHLAERVGMTGLLCDLVIVIYQLIISFFLRFRTPIREVGISQSMTLHDYSGYIFFGAATLIGTLAYFQLYRPEGLLQFRFVSTRIAKGTFVWFIGFLCFSLVFKFQPPISRVFVAIAGVNCLVGLLAWRALFHHRLLHSSIGASLRQRILFVGWTSESERLARSFRTDEVTAYDVIGCVNNAGGHAFERHPAQVPVLGYYEEIEDLIKEHSIDIVLLSDLNCAREKIIALVNLCEKEMIQFKIIPSYFQILVSGLHLETVGGIPVLGVTQLPLNRFANVMMKRLVDIVGALIGLLVFAPVIAGFGFFMQRESPGPLFYRQRRLGKNGMAFDILKIRSMHADAEKDGRVGWTTKNDPRALRIGAVMRRWNIDEMPQFWNVLKGEMSLVGPRPERPEFISKLKHEIPHYNARHNVKPGMTGWAQVKGLRGDTDLRERISSDLFYLENWSLMLDFQIMGMTFFRRENAC